MGIYLNPGKGKFQEAVNSKIYVDKTELIEYTNSVLCSNQKYICVSRPRRFGKSITANMLTAYYGRNEDSSDLFRDLKISSNFTYRQHLNHYNVIALNMQDFISQTHNIETLKNLIERVVIRDLLKEYSDVDYFNKENLIAVLLDIYAQKKEKFIFIIDEWDCIFRELKEQKELQREYLDYLRNLLKDKEYVALAYMTGILPIKKYGTHSALNMFDEFSMTNAGELAKYTGFTEEEVKKLCDKYKMDFNETERWYDGYELRPNLHIYNPKSVVDAMRHQEYGGYWTNTETYEALKIYLDMNYDGLKDNIIKMLAGERCPINPRNFKNDMTSFSQKDDVFTLMVHLGYLGYDKQRGEVYIPNQEIADEFINAMKDSKWDEVIQMVKDSQELLNATLKKNTKTVEELLERVHLENTSILNYNDENALSCVITLAYYAARKDYVLERKLPTGKGFADIVFIPRKDKQIPAMIIELKWDKDANSAIQQIKERKYTEKVRQYSDRILLVGINYDKKKKIYDCKIEESR